VKASLSGATSWDDGNGTAPGVVGSSAGPAEADVADRRLLFGYDACPRYHRKLNRGKQLRLPLFLCAEPSVVNRSEPGGG